MKLFPIFLCAMVIATSAITAAQVKQQEQEQEQAKLEQETYQEDLYEEDWYGYEGESEGVYEEEVYEETDEGEMDESTEVAPSQDSVESSETDNLIYIGEFEITAYSYNEGGGENYGTAGGYMPEPYYTVAVDPNVISLGTILYIDGIGYVQAQDTGGAVNGNIIDLHIGYDNPENFGRQVHSVYIVGD